MRRRRPGSRRSARDSENATRELADARSRVENLSQRVTDLDRQLIIQVKEAEMLGNRVNDLEARLATQGKLLAEREFENNQLKQANEAAERTVKELRDEIAALSSGGNSPAIEKLRSEKAAVEEQLRVARDERAKLQRDINAIQQQAESSWATERMENALLRERINDIAAEVAKLAIQLEGPNSAIEAMLAAEPAAPKAPAKPANDAPAPPRWAPRKAAARSPNASGRCSPTPPAPASKGRNSLGASYGPIDRLTLRGPALRKSRALTSALFRQIPGRIAQRESVPFTRERSKVRSLVRPPFKPIK